LLKHSPYWNTQGDEMKLTGTNPTKFHLGETGFLVISQQCVSCGDEASFLLSPEQTKILFDMLPEIIFEQNEIWTGIDKE
jgi:hypothetical protein